MVAKRNSSAPVSASKRVTYALAGAGMAVMALPLVSAVFPGEAGATRNVPAQVNPTTTSIGVTSVVPTESTIARTTLVMAVTGTQTVQTFNPGTSTYTVSSGVCTVEVIVSGAAGGNVQGTTGGRGSQIRGQFAVAAGDKFDITVGAYRGGGSGGLPELNGGGATKIVKQSNAAVIVEAAGGGGDGLGLITRTNASLDTLPGATTVPGGTYAPAIKVNVVPGRGADAPATTAVSPVTASVQVPTGNVPGTSTTLVTKTATATAGGAATDSAEGALGQFTPATTDVIAKVRVDVYRGGAGAGGSANAGGADADGGSAGNIILNVPGQGSAGGSNETFSAPYVVGAAVGGSSGSNTIGNGFLKLAESSNDAKDGKVQLKEISCSTSGSTLPPLGGGSGSKGPLVPAALALIGAGVGLLVVRRRSAQVADQA